MGLLKKKRKNEGVFVRFFAPKRKNKKKVLYKIDKKRIKNLLIL